MERVIINSDGISENVFLEFTDHWFDEIVTDDIEDLLQQYYNIKGDDLELDTQTIYDLYYKNRIVTEISIRSVRTIVGTHITNQVEGVVSHNDLFELNRKSIIRKFVKYFDKKNWHYEMFKKEHFIQYKVLADEGTDKEAIGNINFYKTGTIVVQGQKNHVVKTLNKMKDKVLND